MITTYALASILSLYSPGILQNQSVLHPISFDKVSALFPPIESTNQPPATLDSFLGEGSKSLETQAADKLLSVLQCVKQQNIPYQPILTLIDYHLPANQKRLWVFDLNEKKLLYHTYVSHGIKSGRLFTNYFSNRYNSKASSIGVYKTSKIYYGRQGLSLRLDGLDRGFNDNANNRAIVMHGGWYVNENFIQKYGRPGRSWGCPALPLALAQPIIHTIKENTLFVVYYPDEKWLEKSKFLNCQQLLGNNEGIGMLSPNEKARFPSISLMAKPKAQSVTSAPSEGSALAKPEEDPREAVLFADFTGNHNYAESKPLVVMSAANYAQFYGVPAPLNRMIRRQINEEEYIALSPEEFQKLALKYQEKQATNLTESAALEKLLYFVTPSLRMQRGYYVTDMKLVSLEKLREPLPAKQLVKEKSKGPVTTAENPMLQGNQLKTLTENYTLIFSNRAPIQLEATKQFIRWLGL